MARPETSRIGSIVLAGLSGVCIAYACVPLVGISAAIAAPKDLFSWAKANDLIEPALFAWEMLVVGGLGIAIPALAAMVVLCLAFPVNRFAVVAAFVAAFLAGHYRIVPATYFESPLLFLDRRWWSLGQELSLAIVVGLVCLWRWREEQRV